MRAAVRAATCLSVAANIGCSSPPTAPARSLLHPPSATDSAPPPTDAEAPVEPEIPVAPLPEDAAEWTGEPAPAQNEFVWVEGEPEFLDPNKTSESVGSKLVSNLFEPLLNYAPGNTAPVPGVAERYDVSEDGRTYTFYLRHNAKWSNGRPVVAEDFVYAWRRGLSPATASQNASNLWYLRHAKAYNEGSLTDFEQVGVHAEGDRILRVDLESPTPFFLSLVAYPAYAPVPREVVEEHGIQWTRPEHMVTNGAFTLEEWTVRDRVVLKKSPTYWGAEDVFLDRAVKVHGENEDMAFQLYESGKVHWTPAQIPTEKIPQLLESGRPDFHVDPILCVAYYFFNVQRPPLDRREVRHAINRAIDRERITKHILRAGQTPATRLVPPTTRSLSGYEGPSVPGYDPEAAAALLAAAGYPQGEGMPPLSLAYNTYEANRLMAESMQRNLADNLHVRLESENMEWKSLLKRLSAADFQIGRGGWCADYPDAMTFLAVFHSSNEQNRGRWKSAEFDRLIDAANAESDPERRNGYMASAEQVLMDDAAILPIYFYTRSYLLKPWVQGFEPQYQDIHLLKYLSFAR